MDPKPTLRPATADDLEALLELYTHLIVDEAPCPLDIAQTAFAQFLQYRGSAILLREVGPVLVASCALVIIPNLTRGGAPYALIENVVTHTRYRGLGHGTAVLDAACQQAWENGCYKVMLLAGSKHPDILGFYTHAGFEQSKTGFQKRRRAVRHDV